jgi:hypothetical protein
MGSQISLGQWGLVLLVLDCQTWLAIDCHDCPARLTSEGDNVRKQLTEPVFRLDIDHLPLSCLSLFLPGRSRVPGQTECDQHTPPRCG